MSTCSSSVGEFGVVAVDAESVGQGQRDLAAGLVRDLGRGEEGGLRLRPVEQIAFQIGDLGRADQVRVDVVGIRASDACAQEGVHRTLRVGRDQDQAARGRLAADQAAWCRSRRRWRGCHGRRPRPADRPPPCRYRRRPAQRGDAGHRVGGRSARDFDRRRHARHRARSPAPVSIKVMPPLAIPSARRKASSASASTSTMALPTPRTSRVAYSLRNSGLVARDQRRAAHAPLQPEHAEDIDDADP